MQPKAENERGLLMPLSLLERLVHQVPTIKRDSGCVLPLLNHSQQRSGQGVSSPGLWPRRCDGLCRLRDSGQAPRTGGKSSAKWLWVSAWLRQPGRGRLFSGWALRSASRRGARALWKGWGRAGQHRRGLRGRSHCCEYKRLAHTLSSAGEYEIGEINRRSW